MAVQHFGVARWATWLARAHRQYPYPVWSDPERPSAVPPGAIDASILGKVPSFAANGVTACLEARTTLEIVVDPRARARIRQAFDGLSPGNPVAILTEPDPRASVRLVWEPGQTQPEAVGIHGADMAHASGTFVLLSGGQGVDSARLHEDGFLLMLTDATWARAREALTSGPTAELSIPGADITRISIRAGS